MSSHRAGKPLVTGAVVAALMIVSSAWAGAQQAVRVVPVQEPVAVRQAPRIAVAVQEAQEVQERARAELRRAYEIAQVMPSAAMRFFATGEGRLADRVIAAAEDLALSDSQLQGVRDVKREFRRGEIRRDADIEIAELELDEMMEASDPDLDAIESHLRQIANLEVDERMARLRLDRAVKDILTAEQIDKIEEMTPRNLAFGTYWRRSR